MQGFVADGIISKGLRVVCVVILLLVREKDLGRIRAGLVSGVWVLLLFVALFGVVLNVPVVKGDSGTIYIRADGSIDPPTAPIQRDGNLYHFTANLNNSVVIERSDIVVDGSGYTVQGNASVNGVCAAINLTSISNVTIKNTTIKGFSWGVYVYCSSNNIVSENDMTDNGYGIYLQDSFNNFLSGNNITSPTLFGGRGIYLTSSGNNTVSGNNITHTGFGFYLYYSWSNTISANNIWDSYDGEVLWKSSGNTVSTNIFVDSSLNTYDSYENLVVGNTVNGKPLVYLEGVSDMTVEDAGQVILVNCNRIRVENLNISDTYVSIRLWGTRNSTVSGNNLIDNFGGVYLDCSSCGNIISGNSVITTNHYGFGIDLAYSNNNSVSRNNLDTPGDVGLDSSSDNIISENNITGDYHGSGVNLLHSSNNTISRNLITHKYSGVSLLDAYYNRLFHNNFIDNNIQVYFYDSSNFNTWDCDYPYGGNYWSDYSGVDLNKGIYQNQTGSDGIGDTPYVIDSNNQDNYPLMKPWAMPRLHVPHQAQDSTNWCGPTCLAMILRYYGKNVHSWDVADDLDLGTNDGVDLGPGNPFHKNLYDYLRDCYSGLNVHLGKYASKSETILEDVRGNLTLGFPVIAALKLVTGETEVYHGVSVVGSNETGFFVNDPGDALALWTGRGLGSPIQFYITNSELYDALYVPDTGTILVVEVHPPAQFELQGTLSLYRRIQYGSDIYIKDPETEEYSYVDLDKGLKWKSSNSHEIDKNDLLSVNVVISNHFSHSQDFNVSLTLLGEDGITYLYEEKRVPSIQAFTVRYSWGEYVWTDIPLRNYLTKSQKYQIIIDLINATRFAVDEITVPQFYYSNDYYFMVTAENMTYSVVITSNSSISHFNFTEDCTKIRFNIEGTPETSGFCNVTIPLDLLAAPYSVLLDNTTLIVAENPPTNGTHAFIYFNYAHSSHTVEIVGEPVIPESPLFIILPLFMIATLLAVIAYKRKRVDTT